MLGKGSYLVDKGVLNSYLEISKNNLLNTWVALDLNLTRFNLLVGVPQWIETCKLI